MSDDKGDLIAKEDARLETEIYDPMNQLLDLDKGQKLRCTALLMAIQYVTKTICGDAQMYQALKADGKELVPANVPHVIRAAMDFESFLLGDGPKVTMVLADDTKNTEEDRGVPAGA